MPAPAAPRLRQRIAVLLTVHNRCRQTLACLEALAAQDTNDGRERLDLRIVLVDDGCTDGTAGAVRTRFPGVEVLAGDGSLFWCGGMRLALDHVLARPEGVDYHLWLNDDTELDRDALARLLACHRHLAARGHGASIVVGSTADPATGEPTYGGFRRLWPLPFLYRVRPGATPRRCTTMNGNCVLVPARVAERLGSLDPALTHLRGDIDYGLRARRRGIGIWLAPGTLGRCAANPIGRWRDPGLPLSERLASLDDPKYGLAEKNLVARRHYGPLWFLSPLAVYGYIYSSHLLHRAGRVIRGMVPRLRGGRSRS